eukprot:1875328-Pyramimonas_sp.AAC.1
MTTMERGGEAIRMKEGAAGGVARVCVGVAARSQAQALRAATRPLSARPSRRAGGAGAGQGGPSLAERGLRVTKLKPFGG